MKRYDAQMPGRRKRLELTEEFYLVLGALLWAAFMLLLFTWPAIFHPIVAIPVSKALSAIGLLLDFLGAVSLAADLLQGDSEYLHRRSTVIEVFFMISLHSPTFYFIIRAVVLEAPWNILGAVLFFFLAGYPIAILSERFGTVLTMPRHKQGRAMAVIGIFLIMAGFGCQLAGVLLA